MKVVYVAGPYRSKDGPYGVKKNIDAAWEVARQLWGMGFAVICPHTNSAFMDAAGDAPGADNVFVRGDLEIVRRVDALVLLPGWENSAGACAELRHATVANIPRFYWLDDLDELAEFAHS